AHDSGRALRTPRPPSTTALAARVRLCLYGARLDGVASIEASVEGGAAGSIYALDLTATFTTRDAVHVSLSSTSEVSVDTAHAEHAFAEVLDELPRLLAFGELASEADLAALGLAPES